MTIYRLLLLTLAALALSCTKPPDPKLRPAQLWRDAAGPDREWGRIEDRELLGTFTMDEGTCVLRLNDGSVTRRPDNFIRHRCYGELFSGFVKTMPMGPASYAWGDIRKERAEGGHHQNLSAQEQMKQMQAQMEEALKRAAQEMKAIDQRR